MFLLLFGICFSHVSYAEDNVKNLPAKTGVDVTKSWSIKFNAELMPSTVNSQNIMVLDANGTQVSTTVMIQGKDTVVVSPSDKYDSGETYTLVVTPNVKSVASGNIQNSIKMVFTTKDDGSKPNNNTYTVVIDAGHGGNDSTNITGPSGVKEQDVDLAVALKVGTILKSSGVNVVYTRTSDTYLDYASRVKISNDANADYYVSIHCNTATTTATGTDIIYTDGDSDSLNLATAVQDSMNKFTGLKERPLKDSTIPEAQGNNASTIKVLLGFLSNPDEEKILASDDFQNKSAQAIANAILQSKKSSDDNSIVSASNAVLSITQGQSYTLPSTVQVQYKDGTAKQMPVTWNTSGVDNNTAGTYTCTGVVTGYSKPVYATLIVMGANSGNKPTVTIDAGHGGQDPGAVGYEGLKESDVTLAVALKTGKILEQSGVNVIYTRTSNDVSWPTGTSDAVVKDLQTRVDISNTAKSNYYVSIHCNSADASAKGTETYYYSTSVAGKVLAQNVQSSLIGSINSVDRGVKTANWYVIVPDHINAPSILTEIGFVTNPDEAALMESDAYQQKVAQGIANGILKSLGK